MNFNGTRFIEIAAHACASAARTFGFRNWATRTGSYYTNPFPEVYATAEAVRLLTDEGFRVMPEVIVHEVLRKGGVGAGSPGKRGLHGRFDVTAWNKDGSPAAAMELKWKWNSVAADVARLKIAHRKIGVRTFIGVLAAEKTAAETRRILVRRVAALEKHGVKVVKKAFGRPVRCWEIEGGRRVGPARSFSAAMVEIVPVERQKRKT